MDITSPDLPALLDTDDLQRWRSCTRRFWLQRQRAASASCGGTTGPSGTPGESDGTPAITGLTAGTPAITGLTAGTPAGADLSAEAAVVHGPAPDQALRATFPGAVHIAAPGTPAQWTQALQQSAAALADPRMRLEGHAVFGLCLRSDDGAQVRIEVLERGTLGMRLYKVRYATVADEADVDAVALWAHVAARCGLRVQRAGLLLVDTDFIYPGHACYAGLFREVDLGPVLGTRPVAPWLVAMRACARGPQPEAAPGAQCTQHGPCNFITSCHASQNNHAGLANPAGATGHAPASLEIVGRELAAELREEGHRDLLTVSEQRLSDARHRRALRAIQQGAPVLEPRTASLIHSLPWPRHTLRMDTIGFAVPVWAGTRPYQVLPFQWTCDVQAAPDRLQRHGFLAGTTADPRREFAQTLLQVLGEQGPVFAYNAGFERNRIRELAMLFDDLAPALEALLPRIVDLFQIARTHYYHPAMCGSWSFKSICRAVAPDLPVDRFQASGETSTQAAFARSLQRGLDEATLQSLRAALLAHGQTQTEALRRLLALFEAAT